MARCAKSLSDWVVRRGDDGSLFILIAVTYAVSLISDIVLGNWWEIPLDIAGLILFIFIANRQRDAVKRQRRIAQTERDLVAAKKLLHPDE